MAIAQFQFALRELCELIINLQDLNLVSRSRVSGIRSNYTTLFDEQSTIKCSNIVNCFLLVAATTFERKKINV